MNRGSEAPGVAKLLAFGRSHGVAAPGLAIPAIDRIRSLRSSDGVIRVVDPQLNHVSLFDNGKNNGQNSMCMYIYIYVFVYMYIYIYILRAAFFGWLKGIPKERPAFCWFGYMAIWHNPSKL